MSTNVNITKRENIKIDRYGNVIDKFGPAGKVIQKQTEQEDELGGETTQA